VVNKVILMGYLGRDPEAQYTPQGNMFCKFTMATTRKWRDGNGDLHQETEWSNVIAWNGLAEACNQFLVKGRLVYVEGYLKTDRWEADGVKQRRTSIVAEDIRFIPTSKQAPARPAFEVADLPADLGQPAEELPQTPKRNGRRKQPSA
jgi:single-strand DNA-binding protein